MLNRTFGETAGYDDFVLVRDIPFTSHCEHHVMPFYGVAHVAYLPVGRVVGLSKLARLVDIFARRLQTQEHLTAQIAGCDRRVLQPRGVAILIEAEHTCMSVRGIGKDGAFTLTTRFTGVFHDNQRSRSVSCPWCAGRSARAAAALALESERFSVSTTADIDREERLAFRPKFDSAGLVTCVTTDASTRPGADGRAHERRGVAHDGGDRRSLVFQPFAQRVVAKGETSGQIQRVVEMRIDCDQDAVWMRVDQVGRCLPHRTQVCFYRRMKRGAGGARLNWSMPNGCSTRQGLPQISTLTPR